MGYPTAYRRGAPGSGAPGPRGFQPGPGGLAPYMPAPYQNPGFTSPPPPANDNRFGGGGRGRGFLRGARRALPYLQAAQLAIDATEWWMQGNPAEWVFPSPWYRKFQCNPPFPYLSSLWSWSFIATSTCLVSQATTHDLGVTPAHLIAANPRTNYMTLWWKSTEPRAAVADSWERPTRPPAVHPKEEDPYLEPMPWPIPRAPHEVPFRPPAIAPDELKPGSPQPEPQPIPYPEIPYRPYPDVVHGPDHGYAPGRPQPSRPRPRPTLPSITPQPQPQPEPQPQPQPVPPIVVINPNAPAFPRQRVGAREKERKIMSSTAGYGAMLDWASRYENMNDAKDLVGAVHDALPKHLQSKSKRVQDQLEAIYRNINDLDVVEALQNIAKEIMEDYLGGKLDQARGKAGSGLGVTKQQIRTIPGL